MGSTLIRIDEAHEMSCVVNYKDKDILPIYHCASSPSSWHQKHDEED